VTGRRGKDGSARRCGCPGAGPARFPLVKAVACLLPLAALVALSGELPAQEEEESASQVFLSGRTEQGVWRLSGTRLRGTLDGPVTIDSVQVQHGSLHIRALQGIWLPENEAVELRGAVVIRDSVRTLWAERGFYHRARQILELEESVVGEGPEGEMRADRLRYDRGQRQLVLNGAVSLVEEGRRMRSSWLHYDLADSTGRAGEPVEIHAEADSIDIYGRQVFYDRAAGRMTVVGTPQERPRLERSFGEKAEKLVATADTLEMGTATREGEARGRVTIVYEGAETACARAIFLMEENRVLLTGEPLVWDEEGVITGDSMAVQLREGRADRLIVWGTANSEYLPSAPGAERYFAIGDTLTAYLQEGKVRSVVLEGRAQALYLPAPEARAQGTGMNWTKATRLRLAFGAEGAERVQFEGGTEGLYVAPYKKPPPGQSGAAAPGAPGAAGGPTALPPPDAPGPGGEAEGTAGETASEGEEDSPTSPEQGGSPSETRLRIEDLLPTRGDPPADVLAAIRAGARSGELRPDEALMARLPYDPAEGVRYEGERIDYDVRGETMTISGSAAVHYQTMGLSSSEITFYVTRDLVVAKGEPVLSDRETEVAGTEMTYRIDRRQGLIFQGRSELETGYYRGERIKRATPEALFVREGCFSTCSEESTHYHFRGPKMKVVPGERVVARPVVLYIGNIPVLAIPYAVFPIRSGRQSGILIPDFELGFDTSRGRFLRNIGYYWAPNDYFDTLFWLDYYEEEPSTIFNLESRYRLRYLLSGQFEASFTREGNAETGRRDRWLVRVGHDQVLGERANLKISGNFQSDKDYGGDRDFGASVDERINQVLRSQLSLNQSWSFASLSVYADRTENLDRPDEPGDCSQRISQSIPSVNLSLNSLPLGVKADERGRGGRLGWLASTYLRGDLRFRSIYSKDWCDERETNQAAGVNLSLSDNRRLLGILSVTPSASLSAAWAHEDEEGEKNRTGASWSTGISTGTVIYGTFAPNLGPWEGLRHVLELNAAYTYRPELKALEGFPNVGGIGLSSSRASTVALRATQRFHLKLRAGEKTIKEENVLVCGTSVSYDFLAEEKAKRPWSDFSQDIRLQPGRFLGTDLSITHNPYRWRDDYRLSLRTSLRLQGGGGGGAAQGAAPGQEGYGGFGDPAAGIDPRPGGGSGLASLTGPWQLTMSHVLSKSAGEEQESSVNLSAGWSATSAWRIQYSLYYDLTDKEVTSQGYSLYRDLHCWQAMFERRESGGRSSYYFRISVKDLPDIKYERRRF